MRTNADMLNKCSDQLVHKFLHVYVQVSRGAAPATLEAPAEDQNEEGLGRSHLQSFGKTLKHETTSGESLRTYGGGKGSMRNLLFSILMVRTRSQLTMNAQRSSGVQRRTMRNSNSNSLLCTLRDTVLYNS